MAMSASWSPADSSAFPGSFARGAAPAYAPLTENEVVSTCTCSALTPKIWRARLAIPANSLVRSCAYNQSKVRAKQSTLSHLGSDPCSEQVLDRDARQKTAAPNTAPAG